MFYDEEETELWTEKVNALNAWINHRPVIRVYDCSDVEVGAEIYATFDTVSQKYMYDYPPRWGRIVATGDGFSDIVIVSARNNVEEALVGNLWGLNGIMCNVYVIHDPV